MKDRESVNETYLRYAVYCGRDNSLLWCFTSRFCSEVTGCD